MPMLVVQVTRLVDDHFPGFVECSFLDAFGRLHSFVEKAPVVTEGHLSADSAYPQAGAVRCEIEAEWRDEADRALMSINTERPWGIESIEGETRFVVSASDVRLP
jgi:hypothetical protein